MNITSFKDSIALHLANVSTGNSYSLQNTTEEEKNEGYY